jgi:hypothetical protein
VSEDDVQEGGVQNDAEGDKEIVESHPKTTRRGGLRLDCLETKKTIYHLPFEGVEGHAIQGVEGHAFEGVEGARLRVLRAHV